jgi:hypothetical protein
MVNHEVGMYSPQCPVCNKSNSLTLHSRGTIREGLPNTLEENWTYYQCTNCRLNMNSCCFVFYKGTVYVYSDNHKWEELEFNPSKRYGENYEMPRM